MYPSSVERLSEFINERLTAAAGEIFGAFRKTIVDLEDEINRQSKLLDITLKPEVKLHRIDVCKSEKVLCVLGLDQEDPQSPQLELKQETDALTLTPTNEDRDHTEDKAVCLNPEETVSSAPEEQTDVKMPVIVSVLSESNGEHWLLYNNSHLAESPDQDGDQHGDAESTKNTESRPKKRPRGRQSHTKIVKVSLKCDICGKTFRSQSLLTGHMVIHTGEKPFTCETCGKRFFAKRVLTNHMRIHSGEKPFTCETCGKDFRIKNHLTRHMRTHTGEKPFTCETCEKGFGQSTALMAHKRRAHTGEKPYVCNRPTCGKRFFEKKYLNVHDRIHSGEKTYICKTCGKAFRTKSNLTRHMRTHTGEKPFTCETCGKDFRANDHLRSHMLIHTGEKPHSCDICGKRYRQSWELKTHSKIHTNEEAVK